MDWGAIWTSTAEARAETWDVVLGVGQAVVAEKVQKAKESAKDPDKLRENEPVKGVNADGSTIVVGTTQAQPQQAPVSSNLIEGVDNRLLIAGGLVAAIVLIKVL